MHQAPDIVLFHAALSFAAAVSDRGDPRLGPAIGLRADQLDRLRDLSAGALMSMASKSAGCVQVEIDADVFDELLDEVTDEIDQSRFIDEFIRHDASSGMMADLFSMSRREYGRARRSMGMEQTTGRTRKLTEEEEAAVYAAWLKIDRQPEPADYLTIARKLDIPLRVLWDDELARAGAVDLA